MCVDVFNISNITAFIHPCIRRFLFVCRELLLLVTLIRTRVPTESDRLAWEVCVLFFSQLLQLTKSTFPQHDTHAI